MRRPLLLVTFLSLVTFLAGCSGGRSPSEPSADTDSISITSLSPAAGIKLTPGSTVTFAATVAYSLGSAATGTITLVIEDQNFKVLTIGPQKIVAITRGRGSVSLSDQITVPTTGVIQVEVFLPLSPQGATMTKIVDKAIYPVGP